MSDHRKRKLNIPRLILVIVLALLLVLGLWKLISGIAGGGKAKPSPTPDETADVMPSGGEGEPSGEVTPTPETTPETTPDTNPTPTPEVTPTPTPETTPGGQSAQTGTGSLVVKVDNLNIRSGPGTTYTALRKAVKGKSYRVYESKQAGGYTWYRIGDNEWLADRDKKWVEFRAD